MADGATSDGSEHTTSLVSKGTDGGINLDSVDDEELGKLQLHAISVETRGKNPALAENQADKHQGKPLEKVHVAGTDMKPDKQEPPNSSTVFKECQECKIIRTNLDKITRLISSDPSAGLTWFAQKLEEKAFIANAADAVVLGYTRYEQIGRLMSAVKGKISTSLEPGREYLKFIEILESNPQSEDLASELCLEYAFEECQYKIIRANLDRITWLISSILDVVVVSADEDDLAEVRSVLLPIANRWKDAGIELKPNLANCDTIQAARLRNAVSRWLQKGYNTTKYGPPTWRKLVHAVLVDAGGMNPAVAENLADLHDGKTPEKMNGPAVKQEPSYLPTGKQPITRQIPTCPLSTGNGLKPVPHIHPEVTITQRNYRMIRNKFASLIRRASNRLQNKGISAEDLVLFLEAQYSSENSKDGSDFAAAVIELSSSIGGIFRAIGKQGLWSYWDYFLLQSLVEEFVSDDEDLQSAIQQYEEELNGFFFTTTIEGFLEEVVKSSPPSDAEQLPSPCPDNKLFCKVSSKLKRAATNRSLEYIRQLCESFRKKCRLPGHTVLLHKLEEGCICVTWMIPFHLMPQLVKGLCESAADFMEQRIVYISVDGVYLYKEPGAQLSDFPSQKLETVHSVRSTALFAAAEHGNTETVELLLSQSLNPNMLNKDNKTALDVAVEHEQLEVIELLVGSGAMTGESMPEMLHDACRRGDLDIVTALLSNGLYVDCKDESGKTPLMVAAEHGSKEVAQLLLIHQAKVNKLKDSKTALDIAVEYEQLQIVELLVESGAISGEGMTAMLHEACRSGDLDKVISLLSNGLNVDCKDECDKTPLMIAAEHGHKAVVRLLLSHHAKVNTVDKLNKTALDYAVDHEQWEVMEVLAAIRGEVAAEIQLDDVNLLVYASEEGDAQMVDWFLQAGANPNLQTEIFGGTALVTAALKGHTQIVDSLLKAGADPDLQNKNGGTALMAASQVGCTQILDSLLKTGANPDIQENTGGTALIAASNEGHTQIVDSLLKAGANPDIQMSNGGSALIAAALKGHTQIVDSLLKTGANPDIQENDGFTPLMFASSNGHTQIVESLLKAGANPDLPANNRSTALVFASRNRHTQIVDTLLKGGAKLDLKDNDGMTALIFASLNGHTQTVESLLKEGANPHLQANDGRTALMFASHNGHTQTVERLLKAGANPDLQANEDYTALMFPSLEGHTQTVESLLKAGANLDLQNKNGRTAVMLASQSGHTQTVESLLKAGANPDLQDNDGFTAVMLASGSGHSQSVDSLLKAGANPDLQSKNGATPLMCATLNGHSQIVDSLLKEGANPGLQDNNGFTAVLMASWSGHSQIVDSLLKAGATPDLRMKSDSTTELMLASSEGHTQIVDSLLKAGANPDLQNNDGTTALLVASSKGHTQIVDSLLKAGANPDLQNNDGETALTLAYSKERMPIFRLLLKARANPNHVTMGGKSPLLMVVTKGDEVMVHELILADANPNYIAEDGFNVLMLSCAKGDLEMVDLLLSSSADPNLKQPQTGYTALMLAAKAGHLEIVRKLVRCGANLDESDKDGMTAADIACANNQSEVHQELLSCGAHQGSLIEPQPPAEREDVVGELLKAFLKRMDKNSLLELKSILGEIRSDAPTKGLREAEPAFTGPTELVFEIPSTS